MSNALANNFSLPSVKPFLKWPGGKRLLASAIVQACPAHFGRYIEPFLGGGAVFFALAPQTALLADINEDLINAYVHVRDDTDDIIAALSRLKICPDHYKAMRAATPRALSSRAVRFLYLNKTAFNGIYRVNRAGRFNVPFGCKPGTVVCDANALRAAAGRLSNAKIVAADFEESIDGAGAGDLIYADPPYTTKHDNNGFRRYNQSLFSWNDQIRLSECLHRAVSRKAKVIVSNADHKGIRALYQGFLTMRLSRPSCIAAIRSSRGPVSEALLVSP